ncbi:hypothetical protein B0A48_02958 [Cryoendolithus antarcticus]|uniref:DNA polymerase lambda n=1 Tax=Cryoendolithus antarcticus TaxID=1507870 RepID=A0A1V8TLS4_9PEZI|nr:hypothetical protein B0A48_02958 [Cryoendolithus antarcticus]
MPTLQDDERLREKRAFYDSFKFLQDEDDDAPDRGLYASRTTLRGKKIAEQVKLVTTETPVIATVRPAGRTSLPRSASDTQLRAHSRPVVQAADPAPRSTALANAVQPPLSTRHTFSGVASTSSAVPTTGKRKRDGKSAGLPSEQQIFSGLRFYFFPNNDKNPARRLRITKAIEYGAAWVKDFDGTVTHILVDRLMDYAMLIKFLKIERLPGSVALVTEKWQSDCIAWKALLEPAQDQFKVSGAPLNGIGAARIASRAQTLVSATESDESLELKPAGRGVTARQPTTPVSRTQTQESAQPDAEDSRATVDNQSAKHTDLERQVTTGQALRGPPEPDAYLPEATHVITDELDEAIERAKDVQFAPLDDEDGDSRPSSSVGGTSFEDGNRKLKTMEDRYQCMQAHTGGEKSDSPNASTIAILQQMADYYGQVGDEWRIRAYRKAIATLRNLTHKISTKEEALALPNVGDRLALKIEEIVFTNRLRRLDSALAEPRDQVLQTFMQIYGVGFVQASQWVREGYTTIDELDKKAKLTPNQRIGIDHYEDFLFRIPRGEVEQHGAIVRKALQFVDKDFVVTIGGSFRRGAATSGDIDCIVTHPTKDIKYISSTMVDKLVPHLTKSGFLTAALAVTSKDDGTKWHGASCLPGSKTWRRIDFMLVPPEQLGAAMIAFTGNDIFNRSLRLLASNKGMRLNQRGLYKGVMRGKGREKLSEGELVEGRDEKRIFEVLGVTWRPPEHRVV